MADDIDELLDEVESKFISGESRISRDLDSHSLGRKEVDEGEELDAAIHSICNIPEPVGPSSRTIQITSEGRKCNVVFVGGSQNSSSASGLSHRRNLQKRLKHSGESSKLNTKQYFSKPVFELSIKDLEAESARRKQKERVEILFQKKLAMVTDKLIVDVRKFKRIKSDVWTNFGDVRLLISEEEAKKFNIDYQIIHLGNEEVLLCKTFVACVKCSAVFSYESHSYGTSTLRSHLKSCGKPRFNMKEKRVQMLRQKRLLSDLMSIDEGEKDIFSEDGKVLIQDRMLKFQDQASQLQEQILVFFVHGIKSFDMVRNKDFVSLLQGFIQLGSIVGNIDINHFLFTEDSLTEVLLKSYEECQNAFKEEVEYQYGLSFSTEIWTASMDTIERPAYISICCHYANIDGAYKSVALFTSEFAYQQKSPEDMSSLFNECMGYLQLEQNQKLIVLDYSYNMVTAFEKDYNFIQCISYSVGRAVEAVFTQLCVAENDDDPFPLPSFAALMTQCSALVLHFKDNNLQSSLPRQLVMSNLTFWKTTFDMLQSINEQWDYIADILIERGELNLFNFDQELLSLVVDFLEIFRDSCEELSSVSNPTLSTVIPWLAQWKNHCKHIIDDSPFLATLKSHMGSAIENEVVSRITIFHKLATLLDPRYKGLNYLTPEEYQEAQKQAISMVSQYKEIYSFVNDSANEETILPSGCYSSAPKKPLSSSEEVDSYLSEYFVMGSQDLDLESKFNPLKYWTQHQRQFPVLSKVALWILSCPASAVRQGEPILSANWMLTIKESELPLEHMHACLFVKLFRNL